MVVALIVLMELALVATICLTVWSIIKSQHKVTKAFVWTFLLLALFMLIVLISSRSFVVMFIDTSLAMILITALFVFYDYQAKRTRRS